MSRLRDHRARMDGSHCPDSAGCARLFHPNLLSGLTVGDTCECCGQEVTEDEGARRDDYNQFTGTFLGAWVEENRAVAYAACWEHAGEAFRVTAPDLGHRVLVRNVSGHNRKGASATYTCACGEPADVYLRAVRMGQ